MGAGPPPCGFKVMLYLLKSLSRILETKVESYPKVKSLLTITAFWLDSKTFFSASS
jgi:hypothetical protein